jgi:cytochrome bd-type quinol oxidase subunit 1
MSPDTAFLSRIQFAFTIGYHILWPAWTIGWHIADLPLTLTMSVLRGRTDMTRAFRL